MSSQPQLPGGVAVSDVTPYAWPAQDGLRGGGPHVHLACTEAYIVTAGHGSVWTLTVDGFLETELQPGSIVWFTPGAVHRMIDRQGLRVTILMENRGLTERGDAVLTFPPEVLRDPDAYARAARLPDRDDPDLDAAAHRRRDLAVEGFTRLRSAVQSGDLRPLEEFYEDAAALVVDRLELWSEVWREGPLAEAERTGEQLAALSRRDASYLAAARVSAARPSLRGGYGLCGRRDEYELPGVPMPVNVG